MFKITKLLCFVTAFLITSKAISATQLVKYKQYLIPINTEAKVIVSTGGFSNLGNTVATLELTLESGSDDTLVWFEFGTSNQIQCSNPERSAFSKRMNISEADVFSDTVTGLLADVVYFYRACAISSEDKIASGDIRQFRTTNLVEVRTTTPDRSSPTSATLKASLTAGRNIKVWFALSQPNKFAPACGSSPADAFLGSVETSGAVQVRKNVRNLEPGARYQYRACALNDVVGGDFAYGSIVRFTMNDAPTEVETISPPMEIRANSVTLSGKVISGTEVSAFFVVDDNSNISCNSSIADDVLVRDVSSGERVEMTYTQTNQKFPRKNLLSNTRYYYRFCADGNADRDEGLVQSFVTDGNGDAMTLDRAATRTDQSLTVTGRLTRAGQSKNTWFLIFEGNVIIKNSDCSVPRVSARLGRKVLSNTSNNNTYTINDLDDNTTYTVGFCGEGASLGTGEVSLGGRRVFKTKRNLDTVITAQCGTGEVFSSSDGPLVSAWVEQNNFITNGPPDSSHVVINNFNSNKNVVWQVLESNFRAQTVSARTIQPLKKQVLPVLPVLTQGKLRYGVSIYSSSDNWTAEFGCRTETCIRGGQFEFERCGAGTFPIN